MTTHFRFLAWRIPWAEEPSGLQFVELQRVGNDCNDSAFFMEQLPHPHMTTGKTIPLTLQSFAGQMLSLVLIHCLVLSELFFQGLSPHTPTYTICVYIYIHIHTRLIYTAFTCAWDYYIRLLKIVVVQPLSCVWLFVTPWTAALEASLSFTISQSLLRLMFIEWVMPSNHLILCHPHLLMPSIFPVSVSFPMSRLVSSGGQSIRGSALASVLPMNTRSWFPLGLTGLISLLSKGLSRVFSSTAVRKYQFFSAQPCLWCNSHIDIWLLEKP